MGERKKKRVANVDLVDGDVANGEEVWQINIKIRHLLLKITKDNITENKSNKLEQDAQITTQHVASECTICRISELLSHRNPEQQPI